MRRWLLGVMIGACLIIVWGLMSVNAAEILDSGNCGGEGDGTNLTWTLDDEGTLTISGEGDMEDFLGFEDVPWSQMRDSILKVIIDSGATSIGERSFCNCYNLTEISIPNTVTSIGPYTFYYCSKLTEISIPNSVRNIGSFAFESCENLTEISIPDGVTSIEGGAFYDCNSLVEISIPNSVTSIGNNVFDDCEILEEINVSDENPNYSSINGVLFNKNQTELIFCPMGKSGEYTVPDSVTSILGGAFSGCTNLTKVNISDGVASIGEGAFYACANLTEINVSEDNPNYSSINGVLFNKDQTKLICCPKGRSGEYIIPDSVTIVGSNAFAGCESLTEISIPNSVTVIGYSAFRCCTNLTEISIPNSVTSIGYCTFMECTSLTEISIPNGVRSIGEETFFCCTSLTEISIPNSVTNIGYGAFMECTSLTEISIPNSVTSIGPYTFYYCSQLTEISLPKSVKNIGERAFERCANLTDVYYEGTEEDWAGINIQEYNDLLINATIHYDSYDPSGGEPEIVDSGYCGGEEDGTNLTWTLDDEGKLIISGAGVMVDCDAPWYSYQEEIQEIEIEEGVTSIGESVFSGCINLKEINIPDSVTIIGASAFDSCCSLTEICIPNGVTSIGVWAFKGCSGLTEISIPNSVTSIGEGAFAGCISLIAINVSDDSPSYSSIDGVLFNKEQTGLICCLCCKSGNYIIPNTVTNIGMAAFSDCTGLTGISIPNSVTSIGNWAFLRCTNLAEINIPNSVTNIGAGAFDLCSSLIELSIPNSVTRIDSWTYEGCSSLTTISIPNGVTSIGEWAFIDCSDLTEISIPNSVTNIKYGAFERCDSLQDIYFEGTEEQWGQIEIQDENEPLSKANIHFNCVLGEMESNENGEFIKYVCDDENTLHISGAVSEAQPVLIATFSESGQMVSMTVLEEGGTVEDMTGSEVKIFWVNAEGSEPKSECAIVEL